MLTSFPASTVNHKSPDSGIPLDSVRIHPALAFVGLPRVCLGRDDVDSLRGSEVHAEEENRCPGEFESEDAKAMLLNSVGSAARASRITAT
jgi:hypothetical protein